MGKKRTNTKGKKMSTSVEVSEKTTGRDVYLDVAELKRGGNLARYLSEPPAKDYEQILNSIKESGQLQPVLARFNTASSTYDLAGGWNRCRALETLGRKVWVRAFDDVSDEALQVMAISSNVHNELTPIDMAANQERLRALGWKGKDIASLTNMTEARVSQLRSLLALPDEIKDAIAHKKLTAAAALHLVRLPDAEKQKDIFKASLVAIPEDETNKKPAEEYYSADAIRKAVDKFFAKDGATSAVPATPQVDAEGNPLPTPPPAEAPTGPVSANAAGAGGGVKRTAPIAIEVCKDCVEKLTLVPQVKTTVVLFQEYLEKKITAAQFQSKLCEIQ